MYREVNEMPRCGACGKLLNIDGPTATRQGREVMFCNERCLHIFDTYKEPKYGQAALDGIPELA